MKKNNDISDLIDVTPNVPVEIVESFPVVQREEILLCDNHTPDIEKDFEYTAGNLRNIIDLGKCALDTLHDLAKNQQSPRTYEVLATLLKTISDANKELILLHKEKRGIETRQEKSVNNQTNNIVFTGTTDELANLVKELKG
jgi:hypothetical protein